MGRSTHPHLCNHRECRNTCTTPPEQHRTQPREAPGAYKAFNRIKKDHGMLIFAVFIDNSVLKLSLRRARGARQRRCSTDRAAEALTEVKEFWTFIYKFTYFL